MAVLNLQSVGRRVDVAVERSSRIYVYHLCDVAFDIEAIAVLTLIGHFSSNIHRSRDRATLHAFDSPSAVKYRYLQSTVKK